MKQWAEIVAHACIDIPFVKPGQGIIDFQTNGSIACPNGLNIEHFGNDRVGKIGFIIAHIRRLWPMKLLVRVLQKNFPIANECDIQIQGVSSKCRFGSMGVANNRETNRSNSQEGGMVGNRHRIKGLQA